MNVIFPNYTNHDKTRNDGFVSKSIVLLDDYEKFLFKIFNFNDNLKYLILEVLQDELVTTDQHLNETCNVNNENRLVNLRELLDKSCSLLNRFRRESLDITRLVQVSHQCLVRHIGILENVKNSNHRSKKSNMGWFYWMCNYIRRLMILFSALKVEDRTKEWIPIDFRTNDFDCKLDKTDSAYKLFCKKQLSYLQNCIKVVEIYGEVFDRLKTFKFNKRLRKLVYRRISAALLNSFGDIHISEFNSFETIMDNCLVNSKLLNNLAKTGKFLRLLLSENSQSLNSSSSREHRDSELCKEKNAKRKPIHLKPNSNSSNVSLDKHTAVRLEAQSLLLCTSLFVYLGKEMYDDINKEKPRKINLAIEDVKSEKCNKQSSRNVRNTLETNDQNTHFEKGNFSEWASFAINKHKKLSISNLIYNIGNNEINNKFQIPIDQNLSIHHLGLSKSFNDPSDKIIEDAVKGEIFYKLIENSRNFITNEPDESIELQTVGNIVDSNANCSLKANELRESEISQRNVTILQKDKWNQTKSFYFYNTKKLKSKNKSLLKLKKLHRKIKNLQIKLKYCSMNVKSEPAKNYTSIAVGDSISFSNQICQTENDSAVIENKQLVDPVPINRKKPTKTVIVYESDSESSLDEHNSLNLLYGKFEKSMKDSKDTFRQQNEMKEKSIPLPKSPRTNWKNRENPYRPQNVKPSSPIKTVKNKVIPIPPQSRTMNPQIKSRDTKLSNPTKKSTQDYLKLPEMSKLYQIKFEEKKPQGICWKFSTSRTEKVPTIFVNNPYRR